MQLFSSLKKIGLTAIASFFVVGCLPQTATQHQNAIVLQRNTIVAAQEDFLSAVKENDLGTTDLTDTYDSLLKTISVSESQLNLIESYETSNFLTATKQIIGQTEDFVTTVYKEIVDLYALPKEEISTEQYERFGELADLENDKRQELTQLFVEAQQAFATEYEIE